MRGGFKTLLVAALIPAALLLPGCSPGDIKPAPTSASVQAADWPVPPDATFDVDDEAISVSFDLAARNGYDIRPAAQRDTIAILKRIKADYPGTQDVWVLGWRTDTDSYGNQQRRNKLVTRYNRSTIDRINFANVSPSNIWEIRDAGSGLWGIG